MCWGHLGWTTEHAHNSASEIWEAVSVKERVDEGIDGDEHKVKISEPVNKITATSVAEIHDVDHDARRNIAGKKDPQHDQIGFGEFVFHLYGSLAGSVLLGLAVCQGVHGGDLFLSVLENTHVRKDENEDGTEHGDVGKDKGICDKANEEKHGGETTR